MNEIYRKLLEIAISQLKAADLDVEIGFAPALVFATTAEEFTAKAEIPVYVRGIARVKGKGDAK